MGDLILTEVLQGFPGEREFNTARKLLSGLTVIDLGGEEIAVLAAKNYRKLRTHGVTIRKTMDTVIATRCIADGHILLHNDHDFEPFAKHFGLASVLSMVRISSRGG